MIRHSLFILLLISAVACYEPTEGCLDRDANNFDVAADFPCANEDCCTYPELAIRAAANWGGEEMRFDTTYEDGAGNMFQLTRLRLYLSEIELPISTSDTLTPVDSIDVRVFVAVGDTIDQTLNSNLVLVDQTSSSGSQLSVGEFRQSFESTNLAFKLGMRDPYRSVIPESLSSGHPLARQEGLLNFSDGNGYVLAKLEYQLPNVFPDSTLVFSLYGDVEQNLALPAYGPFSLGADLTVDLSLDHQLLFESVDLRSDGADLADDLLLVLPQVVSISSVTED
ncbi:MAG: MbnP family protein [Bacteroidota bacterium]